MRCFKYESWCSIPLNCDSARVVRAMIFLKTERNTKFVIFICQSSWDVFEGERSGIVDVCFSENREKCDG